MLYLLLVLLLTPAGSLSHQQSSRYSLKTHLPIYVEDDFLLQLHSDNKTMPVYTISLVCCTKYNRLTEEYALSTGYLQVDPNRLNSGCLHVSSYNVTPHAIDIVFRFKLASDGGQFKLFFHDSRHPHERHMFESLGRLGNLPPVLALEIALMQHWRLELIQRTPGDSEGGLLPGTTGLLVCKATGGVPFTQARFSDVSGSIGALQHAHTTDANSIIPETSSLSNEAHLSFTVRVEGDLEPFECMIGNSRIKQPIRVFRGPPLPYILIICALLGSIVVVLLLLALLWYCVCLRMRGTRYVCPMKSDLLIQSSTIMNDDDRTAGAEKSLQPIILENGSIHKVKICSSDPVHEV